MLSMTSWSSAGNTGVVSSWPGLLWSAYTLPEETKT